ncbi:diacylglycerol/lipid kinase family protein [Pseudoalteromonas luteoviolacea]|uniref:diacylglycerol/lipid kinase family protein n=1 Tax=Pseudoalteromonas luteoviolacea TaxID=43657 RepID=UPI0023B2D695|nr:diacylglycerol kinase family protein [Pseudoalteromonas luteoviolacea]
MVVYGPHRGKKMLAHRAWLKKMAMQRQLNLQWYATCGCFDEDVAQVKLLLRDHQQVTVLGGDGTLNMVVNALFEGEQVSQSASDKRMAILPCGTGNDFARSFGYSLAQWRSAVFSECSRQVDVGSVDQRYFINMAGIGFNAEVVESMAGEKRFGAMSYTFFGIAKLLTYSGMDVNIDGVKQSVMMCLFANGRHFAAGLTPTPSATLDSGALQMLTMPACSLPKRLLSFALMLVGLHTRLPWVKVSSGQCFEISSQGAKIEADGELIAVTPARVTTYAALLKLNVPNSFDIA